MHQIFQTLKMMLRVKTLVFLARNLSLYRPSQNQCMSQNQCINQSQCQEICSHHSQLATSSMLNPFPTTRPSVKKTPLKVATLAYSSQLPHRTVISSMCTRTCSILKSSTSIARTSACSQKTLVSVLRKSPNSMLRFRRPHHSVRPLLDSLLSSLKTSVSSSSERSQKSTQSSTRK